MSEVVVDAFETVEIQEEHGKRAMSSSFPPRHRLAQVIHVEGAVRQTRQRIVQRFVQQSFLNPLAIGNILNLQKQVRRFVVLFGNLLGAENDPNNLLIITEQ